MAHRVFVLGSVSEGNFISFFIYSSLLPCTTKLNKDKSESINMSVIKNIPILWNYWKLIQKDNNENRKWLTSCHFKLHVLINLFCPKVENENNQSFFLIQAASD